MSFKVKRVDFKLSPKLEELGFTEIHSMGRILILSTNNHGAIRCKLDNNDLLKTTEKYLKDSLKTTQYTTQDKETICTEICTILLDSIEQQLDEEQQQKQQEQQQVQNMLNEINQLREQNNGITLEQWQSTLAEKLQNLKIVVDSTMPEIWPGLEFELSILRVLDLEGCTLPFIGIILGRPSSYKTVIISLMKKWYKAFYTDNFTARSFVSHSTAVDAESLDEIDMLPKIKNKLFLTPELSPMFTTKEEDLIQLLGIITRIADGHGYISDSGAHGHRGYDADIMFSWVGAAVDIPYKVYKILGNLGAKLYFYRMDFGQQTSDQLLDYASDEGEFNPQALQVQNALFDYLKWFDVCPMMSPKIKWDKSNDSRDALRYIAGMADLLSYLRCVAKVWETKDSQGSDYAYSISQREVPRRAITCLKNLAKGHALSAGRNYITLDDIPMIIKTALDTAAIERVSLFSLLVANDGKLTTDQIIDSLNVSKPTALRTMAEFKAIGLVTIEDLAGDRGRPSKVMVLIPRFDWFLEDELIKKIIPHTHTKINSEAGNGKSEGKQLEIFWHTLDELQGEEAADNISEVDKLTFNGTQLEVRLVATGQFHNGEAARMIKEMVEAGKLKQVMMDTYTRV